MGDLGKGAAWGDTSLCYDTQGTQADYHCPSFSIGFLSTRKFGGCLTNKIDCEDTNAAKVIEFYGDCLKPPEGNTTQCLYAKACVANQCLNGPLAGDPPGGWADDHPDDANKPGVKAFGDAKQLFHLREHGHGRFGCRGFRCVPAAPWGPQ